MRSRSDLHPHGGLLRAALIGIFIASASACAGCSSGAAHESGQPAAAQSGGAGGEGPTAGKSGAPAETAPTTPRTGSGGSSGSPAAVGGSGGKSGDAVDRAGAGGRTSPVGGAGGKTSAANGGVTLPPLNGGLDYQLGGAYAPVASVQIVSRDRKEQPAMGLYNICYVNGFQAQQEENDFWLSQHADLVLRDDAGKPVIDQDWNEMLFDISTAQKREALAQVMSDWIAGCAKSGFDAVEVDNLDSYSRSGGRLKEQDAIAFVRLLADAAHAQGLAIAQKNASELVPKRADMGTDFVVAEECNRYQECDDYRSGYGDHVLVIEYRRTDFETGCKAYPQLSIVLRDVDLVKSGQSGYVFDGC